MPDILFILILALIIFGPKRLPEIARQIAKWVVQLRLMRDDLKRQLQSELLKMEFEEEQKKAAAPSQPLESSHPVLGESSSQRAVSN